VNPKELKSFIIGSYLGDGTIYQSSKKANAYLKIQHSIKQLDYANWKSQLLGDFAVPPVIVHRLFKGNPYTSCAFQTKVHPFCTRLRKLYRDGRKRLTRSILSYLTPLGLAIWYMDDGSAIRRSWKHKDGTRGPLKFRGLKIAVCSFSDEEVNMLIEFFQRKYNLTFKMYKSKGQYPMIAIYSKGALDFINIIKDYVPECMYYKINIEQETPNLVMTCSELHE
jgi:hypothetical protein